MSEEKKETFYNYPTENGRTVNNFQTYPDVTPLPGYGSYDLNKESFVFLHGWDNTLETGQELSRVLFRHFHWMGYRDNYIGIAWYSDVLKLQDIIDLDASFSPTFPFIDINLLTLARNGFSDGTTNAFQTSRPVKEFLQTLNPQKTTIAAHSLGNLVMWDALRLHAIDTASNPSLSRILVKNTISIQSAVWADAFKPEQPYVHDAEPDSSNNITYSVDELKRHSWASWLRQTGHDATLSTNKFINSTLDNDLILDLEIRNALLMEGYHAYNRDNAAPYRVPATLPSYTPLMVPGMRIPYNYNLSVFISELWNETYLDKFTKPSGIANLSNYLPTGYYVTVKANALDWEDNVHNEVRDKRLPKLKNWLNEVFKTRAGLPLN